jgi:hypothetical protein
LNHWVRRYWISLLRLIWMSGCDRTCDTAT